MPNTIAQYAIGELLDGRYFYIPAYQRGYRWTEKQVGDLLRDLLCFANDFIVDSSGRQKDQFYCLQPVIARPINDNEKKKALFPDEEENLLKDRKVWEIIDGQQRLTTIFLLYKYLLDEKGWNAEKLAEEEDDKAIFHLCYATREGSTFFLENLNPSVVADLYNNEEIMENVDYFHMARAYKYIGEWIKTDGKAVNQRYGLGGSLGKIRDSFFALLNGMKDTIDGSVQVLWYELAENQEKNNIKEFQKINTGKIRLTDAELIKGLFLLSRNFTEGDKYIRQSELAIEWEFIENTLHSNNFWYFLQKKGTDMPNRIDLLFNLIYKMSELRSVPEKEWDVKLKEIDKDLRDSRKSTIFRFYYNRFEGKHGEELQKEVSCAWQEVMTLFRTLDDWFCTPAIYNTIGLLSQCGEDLSRLVMHFEFMPESSTREHLHEYLLSRVALQLRGVKVDRENCLILNSYKEHDNIYKILLALNIHVLNEQNSKLESESDVYKFPFDVLNSQNWDIEHIDSFHTNALKRDSDKETWIETAMEDLASTLGQVEKEEVDKMLKEKSYDAAIDTLKRYAQEVDADEEIKNSIGNLTLLDAQTNRSYGNALFCKKRSVIIKRIKEGVFVPVATQYVFSKYFDEKGTNRTLWTREDMQAYHKYVYDIIINYLQKEED